MGTLRIVGRWLLRLVALVVVLALAALGSLHTSWGRDWLKGRILAAAAPHVAGTLTIEALEGSPLGRPSLRGVRLVDREGHELLRAARVTVDYGLFPLTVHRIDVDTPVVQLAQDASGAWGLVKALTPPVPSAPPAPDAKPFTIGALALTKGSLAVTPLGQPTTTLTALAAEGHLDATKLVVDALNAHWAEGGKDLAASATLGLGAGPEGRLDARASVGASRVEVHDAVLGGLDALAGTLHADVAADDWRGLVPGLPTGLRATVDVQLLRAPGLHAVVTGSAHGVPMIGEATLAGDATYDAAARRWAVKVDARSPSPALPAHATVEGGLAVDAGHARLDAVKLHAETPGIAKEGWHIGAATIDGSVSGVVPALTLEADVAIADVVAGKLVVGAVSGHGRVWNDGRSADVTAHVGDPKKEIEADVHLAIELDAAGTASVKVVDLRARTKRLRWTGSGGELTRAADGALAVRKLRVSSPAGRIDVEGELHPIDGTKNIRLELDDVDLGRLRQGLVLPGLPAQGVLSGTVTISRAEGATVVPSVVFAADVQNVKVAPKAKPMSGKFKMNVSGGRATIDATFTGTGLALTAHLAAHVPSVAALSAENLDEAHIKGQGIDLARLWATMGWKSDLIGRVTTLSVNLVGRKGDFSATVEGLRPRQSSVAFSGALAGKLAAGVLTVEAHGGDADFGRVDGTVVATAPRALLDGRAWRRSFPAALRSAHIEAAGLDLEAAQALLGLPLRVVGHADVVADVPRGATGADVGITLRRAGLFGTDLRLDATLHAKTGGGRLAVDGSAQLPYASAKLSLAARVPTDLTDARAWSALDDRAITALDLTSSDVALVKLVPASWSIRRGVGTVHVSMAAPGAPLVVEAGVHDVQIATLHRQLAASVRVELADAGATLHLESQLGKDSLLHGDGTLAAGRTMLRAGKLGALLGAAAQADVHVDAFPLTTLFDEAELPLQLATSISGAFRVEGTLVGTLAAPQLDAKLSLLDGRVAGAAYALDAGWSYAAGRTRANLGIKQADGGSLEARLDSARRGGQGAALLRATAFRIGALAPLLHAAGLTTIDDASGVINGRLRAYGDPAAPTLDGSLDITNGTLTLHEFLPKLSDIQVHIATKAGAFVVSGRAKSDGGRLEIKDGELELESFVPKSVHGHVSSDKLRIDIAGLAGLATVEADVKLEHDRAGHKWNIDATFGASELKLLTGSSYYGENEDIRVAKKEGGSEGLELHLNTAEGETIGVHDDLGDLGKLDANATLDLDLGREGDEVVTSYTVHIVGGSYTVGGRIYTIDPSSVLDAQPGEGPQLQATAFHTFRTFEMSIYVYGPLSDPQIEPAASSGSYSREYLFQVLAGEDPDDPDPGHATLQNSAVSAAANTMLKRFAPKVAESLSLSMDEAGDTSAPSTRYKVRWKARKNLFFTWRHRTTFDETQNANEAFVEWQLRPWLVLQGNFGATANGGDLIAVWRFNCLFGCAVPVPAAPAPTPAAPAPAAPAAPAPAAPAPTP